MSIFTSKKNTPDVPAELADAYREAEPDTAAFLEEAAGQLASERYMAENPTADGVVMITPDRRQQIYTDHFLALVARAEHLARLRRAEFAAWEKAQRERVAHEREATHRCPVCGDLARDRTRNVELSPGNLENTIRMCRSCEITMQVLRAEACATTERRAAVQAALSKS